MPPSAQHSNVPRNFAFDSVGLPGTQSRSLGFLEILSECSDLQTHSAVSTITLDSPHIRSFSHNFGCLMLAVPATCTESAEISTLPAELNEIYFLMKQTRRDCSLKNLSTFWPPSNKKMAKNISSSNGNSTPASIRHADPCPIHPLPPHPLRRRPKVPRRPSGHLRLTVHLLRRNPLIAGNLKNLFRRLFRILFQRFFQKVLEHRITGSTLAITSAFRRIKQRRISPPTASSAASAAAASSAGAPHPHPRHVTQHRSIRVSRSLRQESSGGIAASGPADVVRPQHQQQR